MIGPKCHPYKPSLVCRGRFDAVMRGAFGWDAALGAYCTTDIPVREQSSAARWFGGERGVEDHSGEPYQLERCPYCSFPLPENPFAEMQVTDGGDPD